MKYTKIYDTIDPTSHIGYKFDGGIIFKNVHTSWSGNEVLDYWSVEVGQKNGLWDGILVYSCDTLKEAKEYVEALDAWK